MTNTQDFSKFGYRELDIAGDLLKAYANEPSILPGDTIQVEFNPNSGNVFLVDSEYNVAMFNGDKMERFYNCPNCGHEGFAEEFRTDEYMGNECLFCENCENKEPIFTAE
jgi:hypothetical protein